MASNHFIVSPTTGTSSATINVRPIVSAYTSAEVSTTITVSNGAVERTVVATRRGLPRFYKVSGANPMSSAGGQQHWRFTSPYYKFKFVNIPSWITITDGSGNTYSNNTWGPVGGTTAAGKQDVYFNIASNTSSSSRNSSTGSSPFYVVQGYPINTPGHSAGYEYRMDFEVIQSAEENHYINLTDNNGDPIDYIDWVWNESSSTIVHLSSDVPWYTQEGLFDNSWVNINATAGSAGNLTLVLSSDNNTSSSAREAEFEFCYQGAPLAFLHIYQAEKPSTPSTYQIQAAAGETQYADSGYDAKKVVVTATGNWWFISPDWITGIFEENDSVQTNYKNRNESNPIAAVTNKAYNLLFAPNSGSTTRAYRPCIAFMQNNLRQTAYADMTFLQPAEQVETNWALSPAGPFYASSAGSTFNLSLSAATDWDYSSDPWASLSPATGVTGTYSPTLSTLSNTVSAYGRYTQMEICDDNGIAQFLLDIYQEGRGGFTLTPQPSGMYNFYAYDPQGFDFVLNTVFPVTVTITGSTPTDWLEVHIRDKYGDRLYNGDVVEFWDYSNGIYITASRNTGTSRQGAVIFTINKAGGGTISRTIAFNQYANVT